MSFSPKRRWFQFSLGTMMLVMLAVWGGLGWWFRPLVIETRRDNGSPRTRFEVRRDWRGRLLANGTQTWFLRNGTRITKVNYGEPLKKDEFYSLLNDVDKFDSLIWLIENTIDPDSSDRDPADKLQLKFGEGQRVHEQTEMHQVRKIP
jgi:hypothetical protein